MHSKFKGKHKILVADSCAGGIAVLNHVLNFIPNGNFVFLADGQKNPFGIKQKEEIIDIVDDWLKYAKNNNFDLLIIACNTASVAVYSNIERLEKKYNIPIITMVDILHSICKENRLFITNKNVVVFGTKLTIESELYTSILKCFNPKKIYKLFGTESEKLVARGLFMNNNQICKARDEIAVFSEQSIDTFILACTCFEFVKDIIVDTYKNIAIINPNNITSKKNLKNKLEMQRKIFNNIIFVTTGELENWDLSINMIAEKVFNKKVEVRYIEIR